MTVVQVTGVVIGCLIVQVPSDVLIDDSSTGNRCGNWLSDSPGTN